MLSTGHKHSLTRVSVLQMTFSGWGPNTPIKYTYRERCTQMTADGQLDSIMCGSARSTVCKAAYQAGQDTNHHHHHRSCIVHCPQVLSALDSPRNPMAN